MKGISIIERHFEKAILALIAIGVGGYALTDVMGFWSAKPKLGGREVSLSEIAEATQKVSAEIKAAQGGTQVVIELPEIPKAGAEVAASLEQPATAGDALPRVMPALASGLFSKAVRPVPLYHEPSFGSVRMIDPVEQRDNAVKIAAGDAGKPMIAFLDRRPQGWDKGDADVIWTRPTAEVDLAAIRKELERSGAQGGTERESLPVHWWQQRDRGVCVLDVQFEREELQADGSWAAATLVEGLPGAASFRGQEFPSVGAALEALRRASGGQEQILRPALPDLMIGSASSGSSASAMSAPLAKATRELEEARQELETKESELDKAGGPYEGTQRSKGGGGSGGGASKGGGGGAGRNNDDSDPNVLRKRRTLTEAVKKIRERVEALEAMVSRLRKSDADKSRTGADEAGADSFLVWANDFQVRPGATYRYRCVLSLLNPFLGRKAELQDSQRKLAQATTIQTAPSEWAIVRVRSPREFFVLEAVPGEGASALGLGRLEMFKLDDGSWRASRDMIEFGDRVGVAAPLAKGDQKVDFTTDWFVVGVVRDYAAEALQARSKGSRPSGGDRPTLVILASASDPTRVVVRRPSDDIPSESRAYLGREAGTDAAAGATKASASAPAKGG
jgi:hypothetical protein